MPRTGRGLGGVLGPEDRTHGSKNSSSEEFLQIVKPAVALILGGEQTTRYGPSPRGDTERLSDIGCRVYTTQKCGCGLAEERRGQHLD